MGIRLTYFTLTNSKAQGQGQGLANFDCKSSKITTHRTQITYNAIKYEIAYGLHWGIYSLNFCRL